MPPAILPTEGAATWFVPFLAAELAGSTSIIFTRTCDSTRKLALMLRNLGFGAVPIHGQMSQPKRLAALNKFKVGAGPQRGGSRVVVHGSWSGRWVVADLTEVLGQGQPRSARARSARAGVAGLANRRLRRLWLPPSTLRLQCNHRPVLPFCVSAGG